MGQSGEGAQWFRGFVRQLFFIKPSVLLVVDDIETDKRRRLELRSYPEFRGQKAVLRIDLNTPDGVTLNYALYRDACYIGRLHAYSGNLRSRPTDFLF